MSVKDLPKHKAPGLDGLCFEVYRSTFDIIKVEILAVQNCITERERITESMRKGVTRLPPKIKDNIPSVAQLRPLTMLNSDYGIRQRMISARMTKIMPSILSSGQLCNHNQKNILFGITNLISCVEYVNLKGSSAAIASYDLDHAFDRAFIPYIVKVMKHMNFGEKFIRLIEDCHRNITTRFVLNVLTSEIFLSFSFRQGDPISMLLYLIYVEPLLVYLGLNIHGLKISNFKEIDDDFCDDIELVLEKEEDLLIANDIFRKFESFSGARLSRTKSKIMGLGGWSGRQDWGLSWLKVETYLKIFGIYFYPTYREILKNNWEILLQKFRNKIFDWNLRSLDSFQQRIDALHIFGTSKLWYLCQALPLPSKYAKKFESIIYNFVWRGKLEKLALDETKNPKEQGGLGIVCVGSKADALFLRQTCRLLAEPTFNSFKHIKFWIGHYLQDIMPDMGLGQHGDYAEVVPEYFNHLKDLFTTAHAMETIKVASLNSISAKQIYEEFTSTFPPPKVIYRHADLPWEDIWRRLNRPVIDSPVKDILFMVIHNVLPTRDRLFRLRKCDNSQCTAGDGEEDVEHLFTSCSRTQVAWAWARRKIMNLMTLQDGYPSNFELLHLAYETMMDDEVLWIVAQYCTYVWNIKVKTSHNYMVDVDKLRRTMILKYMENQSSQNPLAFIPF